MARKGSQKIGSIWVGPSEQAVLSLINASPELLTAQKIGDALYDETSLCAKWSRGNAGPRRRRDWARGLLRKMEKKKIVARLVMAEGDDTWKVQQR